MLPGTLSWSIVYILLSVISHSWLSLADSNCPLLPISVKLGNMTLDNTTARGLSFSIGSPSQPFAFLPEWYVTVSLYVLW
jgi:hypothetical protein